MTEEQAAILVQRSLGGDGRAFEELLRDVEPGLRRLLGRWLAGRPDASADEALQDLRIYLFRRLDRYDPRYPFGVFARGLARNIARRHLYRRSDLAPAGPEDDEAGWSDELSPLDLKDLPRNLRAVMGADRFASPEGPPPPSRAFLELLELFFRCGGYPHQQVSFGYSVLLWGRCAAGPGAGAAVDPATGGATGAATRAAGRSGRRKVPVTGDPDRVVREIGPRTLETSCPGLVRELGEETLVPASFLDRVSLPLRRRLDLTGAQLFAGDGTSRRLFAHLEDRRIGPSRLREYFGSDSRRSVADWTSGVKERIRKALVEPAAPGEDP